MVLKHKTSTPAVVNVGAVPPAKSTVAGQFTVWLPPLVKNKMNEQCSSDAVGLLNVKVFALVSTVALTQLPSVRLMS